MLVTMAQPLQNLFELLFVTDRTPDFSEMLLHHIIHGLLIFCCIVSNFTAVGSLTLLCHSVSDIFMQGTKMFHNMGRAFRPEFWVAFIGNHIFWVWFRLVCLPVMVYETTQYDFSFPEKFAADFSLALPINLTFICTLIVMHYYWYSFLLRATINGLMGKKMKDTQNNLHEEKVLYKQD